MSDLNFWRAFTPQKQGPFQFFNQNKGAPFGFQVYHPRRLAIGPPLGNGRRNTRDTMAAVSNATAATFWGVGEIHEGEVPIGRFFAEALWRVLYGHGMG